MVNNFISLVMLQGINFLLPLISYPYLIRTLEIERYGLVYWALGIIQYFVTFTDFGFNLSGTKYISQHRDHPDKINQFLNSAFIGRIGLGLISIVVFIILIFSFKRFHDEALLYLLYIGIIVGNVMFPVWFFQGMERMQYITIFNLIAKSLSLLPVFFLVKTPEHYIYVPVCYSVGYIIAGLFSIYFIYFRTGMKWFMPSFRSVWFALKDSSTYFLSRSSISLFTNSNTFILGLVCGNTIQGYYTAAEKLYQAYENLIYPLSQVLFPHMSKTKDVGFFRKIFKWVVSTNILLVIFILLISKWIISIIYGANMEQTLMVFRILLIATLFSIPSMLVGYPFLAALGHPKYTNWTVVFISCLHIGLIGVLYLFNAITLTYIPLLVVFSQILLLFLRGYGIKKFYHADFVK
jgi:PST family polysaccharide transporter